MSKPASGAARIESEGVTPQAWYDLIVRRCGLTFRHVRITDVIGLVHVSPFARQVRQMSTCVAFVGAEQ